MRGMKGVQTRRLDARTEIGGEVYRAKYSKKKKKRGRGQDLGYLERGKR